MAASRPVPGALRGLTWLLAIARFQEAARRTRKDAELDETIEATVADPADDPEVMLAKKHRDQGVREALNELSPEHKEIIDLVYYHEKSVDECARYRRAVGAGEDPHVLCPQETGRDGQGRLSVLRRSPKTSFAYCACIFRHNGASPWLAHQSVRAASISARVMRLAFDE